MSVFRLIRLVPEKTRIPFMRFYKPALGLSSLLAVLSIVLVFAPGLNFGIDFRGGILMEIRTSTPADLGQLRSGLNGLGLGEIALQEFGQDTDVLIRIERQEGGSDAQQVAIEKVRAAMTGLAAGPVDYRRVEFVGPKVSAELIEAGATAVVLAVILILIYIWFRFEWHFGVGAVIALVHDVLLSIGMFGVSQLEFNLSTIAALLTIVGYSINDTVVVYDRIRENIRKYKTMPMPDLLNLSINETLSRTVMTSVTTLLALIALAVFGGAVIREFVIAMIWGVLVGTYSSIFIASPLLIILGLEGRHRSGSGQEGAVAEDTTAS